MTAGDAYPEDVPPELRECMERFGGRLDTPEIRSLVDAALRALEAAVSRPGRDREAAFALLAADGLMTRVVERLADAEDPEQGLRDLVEQIVAGHRGGAG